MTQEDSAVELHVEGLLLRVSLLVEHLLPQPKSILLVEVLVDELAFVFAAHLLEVFEGTL